MSKYLLPLLFRNQTGFMETLDVRVFHGYFPNIGKINVLTAGRALIIFFFVGL